MDVARHDIWAAGDRYEPYVGRWSRRVAPLFLDWLAVPPARDWLDVGCGTGALAQTVLARAQPRSVLGIDPSAAFVAHAAAQVPQAHFRVGDAQSLPLADASVDAVVSGLVLNFVPQPPLAAAEMARVVRPGGTVAAYVWDYAEGMQMMRRFWDAAVALDPAAHELDEARRFTLCTPAGLAALLEAAGLTDVQTRPIEIDTVFSDFDDYWSPFLGGQGAAPGYAMSLSEDRRNAVRDRLREALPRRPDGSIALSARAFAVRARRGA